MKYIITSDFLEVPPEIAVCPVCGKALDIDIVEYDTDGQVTEYGFLWQCEGVLLGCNMITSYDEGLQMQGKLYKWLTENYRVTDDDKAKLARWIENVKAWEKTK